MTTESTMPAAARAVFERAGIDCATLIHVPPTAVHKFMVAAHAWIDRSEGLLMFVGERPEDVARFMYYVGEESNRSVRGVGEEIMAYEIDDERAGMIVRKVERERAKP